MDKQQVIERAAYNGKKSAECNFNRDPRMGKTYSQSTIDLARSYPMFKDEILQAHNNAYIEFNKTHKH